MLEVKTIKQMTTEELRVRLDELDEAFVGIEYGSYEYDCIILDLDDVMQALRERGVR
jgi:hypothetical protein